MSSPAWWLERKFRQMLARPLSPPVRDVQPDEICTSVDIIIPVFGAAELLKRCIDSVLEHTDLEQHSAVLICDGPQPAAVEEVLRSAGGIEIERLPLHGGFVRTVNEGMRRSRRDVVLLNSDTVVTTRWIEKLSRAAASSR